MPVFVRTESEDPRAFDPQGKPRQKLAAGSLVSLSRTGPFVPLGLELLRDDRLRSELASALDVPQVVASRRARLLAPVLALPLLWLAWVDWASDEIGPNGLHGTARFMWPLLDVLAAMTAVYDGSRRAPHRRWLVVALVAGGVARILNQSAESCTLFFTRNVSGPASVGWVGAALSIAALCTLGYWLSRTAAPRLVARQVLDALEIEVDDVLALPEPPKPGTPAMVLVGVAALGMWALGGMMKERPLAIQAAGALIVALGGTTLARVFGEKDRGATARKEGLSSRTALHVLVVGAVGFLGAAFAARAVQQGFDAGGNMLRCRDLASFESSGAKRQLLLEAVEALSARARARDTVANLISTAIALPLAYELLFRGGLQRVISTRYSGTSGLFAAALGYAATASMTYESLFYRTVAAGLAFGLVYGEAGVYAAVVAHVLYAAHMLI